MLLLIQLEFKSVKKHQMTHEKVTSILKWQRIYLETYRQDFYIGLMSTLKLMISKIPTQYLYFLLETWIHLLEELHIFNF